MKKKATGIGYIFGALVFETVEDARFYRRWKYEEAIVLRTTKNFGPGSLSGRN